MNAVRTNVGSHESPRKIAQKGSFATGDTGRSLPAFSNRWRHGAAIFVGSDDNKRCMRRRWGRGPTTAAVFANLHLRRAPSSCVLLLLHPSTSVLHLLLLRLVPYLLLRNILQVRKKKRWRLRALKLLVRREMQTAHAFRRFSHEVEGVDWGVVVDLHRSTVTDDRGDDEEDEA